MNGIVDCVPLPTCPEAPTDTSRCCSKTICGCTLWVYVFQRSSLLYYNCLTSEPMSFVLMQFLLKVTITIGPEFYLSECLRFFYKRLLSPSKVWVWRQRVLGMGTPLLGPWRQVSQVWLEGQAHSDPHNDNGLTTTPSGFLSSRPRPWPSPTFYYTFQYPASSFLVVIAVTVSSTSLTLVTRS